MSEEQIDAGSGDYEDSEFFTEAEKVALRYADQMFLDSNKVDAAFYDELKQHYSEPTVAIEAMFDLLRRSGKDLTKH